MDSQKVFDSVKEEKANAMRKYLWRQNLRWLLKACVALAPLLYALSGNTAREILAAVFNSNFCVFVLLNALVLSTYFLSGGVGGGRDGVAEPALYDEFVANVQNRRSGDESQEKETTPEDKEVVWSETTRSIVLAGEVESPATKAVPEPEDFSVDTKLIGWSPRRSLVAGCESPTTVETAALPEEACDSRAIQCYENVAPVSEVAAVTEMNSCVPVVTKAAAVQIEKMKRYRRTQSDCYVKKRKEEKPKRDLQRSETDVHRKSGRVAAARGRSAVEEMTDEEFNCQIGLWIASKKLIQMEELRKDRK